MSLESWAANLFSGSGGGMATGGLGAGEDIGFGGGNLWAGGTGETAGNPLFNFSGSEGKGTWTPSGDTAKGTDWGKIGKAAGELGKGIGGAKALPDSAAASPGGSGGGGGIGRGGGAGLDALVALLAKRREQWMQSALSGELPKQSSTSGLLGL